MDERERGLEFLRKHASNAPDAPTSRVPSAKNHKIVSAIAKGFGPVIKSELDALRREIADKDALIKAQAARITTLESVYAEVAVVRAAIGSLRVEFAEAMADVDPTRRYSSPATSRLLS